MPRSPARVGLPTLVALLAVYLVAGKLGLSLALIHASASAVWPPTGIALAAFLLLGPGVWPAILVGAFVVNVTTAGNAATSLAIAIGNTLEGATGAALVTRFAGGPRAFDRPRDVFQFAALAGLLATSISPTIGVTSLCLVGFARWEDFGGVWSTWWLGDAGGALALAPALILWARDPRLAWTRTRRLEALALAAAIAVVGGVAFGGWASPPGSGRSLSFLCLPLVIWPAFRFGRKQTAAVVALLSAVAVWGTLRGTGPFPGSGANESLVLLQLFMGVLSVTSLSLAAVVWERRQAHERLALQAAELARSNAELDEFARIVSHDLKEPLRAISTLATFIVEDCDELLSGESREHLALLGGRAKRLTRLIDGVHSYSRATRRPASLDLVDSRRVVEEVIDSLGLRSGVTARIDGELPLVRYDRTQLSQVFLNLIQNAVQHLGRASGSVAVSCRERPHGHEFSVRDDGVGIAEADFERIFQIFHTLNPGGESTGVGLAIVRKLVEMHGGAVSVESTVGRGSIFRFTVPGARAPRGA